jgi:hypothetical protein
MVWSYVREFECLGEFTLGRLVFRILSRAHIVLPKVLALIIQRSSGCNSFDTLFINSGCAAAVGCRLSA